MARRLAVAISHADGLSGAPPSCQTPTARQQESCTTAAANATPGDHNVVVRAKGKFNNVDVTTVTNVVVKVEEVKK